MKLHFLSTAFILMVVLSCSNETKEDKTEFTLLSPPTTYPLNLKEGYFINPVSGDSIKPIINSFGDTVKTGIPIHIVGRIISHDSIQKPQSKPARIIKIMPAHLNVHVVPEDLPSIPIDEKRLTKIKVSEGDSTFIFVNSTGDTIPTGNPILAKRKYVSSAQPYRMPALPPHVKDASHTNIQYLDIEQGMNSSRVTSLLEDRRGNLWFGTIHGGVSCYDGTSFRHYTKKEGLSGNQISCMLEDKRGTIWFGTEDGGLTQYDGSRFIHFSEKEGLICPYINCLLEDQSGELWIGSCGGVTRYDGTSFTHYTTKEGLIDNWVLSSLEDNHGNLWFGTAGGLIRFDGIYFTHFTEKDGLSGNYIYCLKEDKNGNIWIGTNGGLTRYDGKSFTNFTRNEGLPNKFVTSLLIDRNGNIWCGMDGVVIRYNGKNFTQFREPESLNNNSILDIIEDQSGTIWWSSYGGGVSRYSENSFSHFTENDGFNNYIVWSMLEDKSGKLWYGTEAGQILKYDGSNVTHLLQEEYFGNSSVWSILEDSHGKFWFGTDGNGASSFDGKYFTHFTEKQGLSNDAIYKILEDKNRNVWFATSRGITKYDGKNWTHYTEKEGLSNNYILTILEDSKGNLWFGTAGGGVILYNGTTFTYYTEKEGLSNNTVWSILEDHNGTLWFGTEGGGVSAFNGISFTHYTEKDGLSNNNVWNILEDKDGFFWFGTEKGLNYLTKSKEHPDLFDITVFQFQDGIRGIDFNVSSMIDKNNQAWWGSGKSLVKLDLNSFSVPTKPPVVYIRQLDINERYIDYRQNGDPINHSYDSVAPFENVPLHLELPYNKNHITFYFSAIDWAAPHKLKYSYLIEGLNKNWSTPTSEAKADFRNIPFGKYTFKVKAIGIAHQWSDPAVYTFRILPPWWHRWWAWILYPLCFAGILRAYIQFRSRRLKIENLKLEAKIKNRTFELKQSLEELKSTQAQLIQSEKMASLGQVTAGIAHEIQNPLNFVNNFSDVNKELLSELKEEITKGNIDEVKAIANDVIANEEKINHHGKRADAIVKSMLQHSRSSSGVKEPTDINALADEYLRLAYHGLRAKDKTFNATMNTDFDPSIGLINVIPQDIGRVFLNLITNAFYAVSTPKSPKGDLPYEPTVTIKTKLFKSPLGDLGAKRSIGDLGANVVEISVSDNGPGIPSSILDKIFQPFFTTKPTGQGTGLGLSLSYDIVKAHGGELKVHTTEGEGTEFTIILPL